MAAFFLDFFEIAFIIIPLLAPVADKLGIDLVWFGVLICANIQTSFMHPPFGFALFYLRGIAPPSIKTSDIYWGAIPWVFLQVILVVIVIFWPGSVTYWLDKPSVVDPSKLNDRDPDAGFAAGLRSGPRRRYSRRNENAPERCPGVVILAMLSAPAQVRVRMRIMKASKLSSATCIHW